MSVTEPRLKRIRLRAPRQHGAVLFDPPPGDVDRVLQANRESAQRRNYDVQGLPLSELATQARRSLLDLARRHTAAYRDVPAESSSAEHLPIFLSGHQPQLFHPGVWLKNFALGQLAERHGGAAVHLCIDNDVDQNTYLRVPGGSRQRPATATVAVDAAAEPVPYESRNIQDDALFASFADRARLLMAPWSDGGMLDQFWPTVVEASRRTRNLGECISQARHTLEGRWGLSTLEVPLSGLCRREPFLWFTAHVLAQLPRFHAIYNESLLEFRRIYRVRSNAHPVPNLGVEDELLESPFWVFSADRLHRRALYAARKGGRVVLSDRQSIEFELELSTDGSADRAVQQLAEWSQRGVAIRPRALTTTMFARLLLSDLFIHGIGGANYDRLTDEIIRRFFGFSPPDFLTVSGTMLLDLPRTGVTQADLVRVDWLLRELRFHPENHVDAAANGRAASLVQQKRDWIERPIPPEIRPQRHREIHRINEALQPMVADRREHLLAERTRLVRQLRDERVFSSREYAFCLFPETTLRPWFDGALGSAATDAF